jgi:hypothetical protein
MNLPSRDQPSLRASRSSSGISGLARLFPDIEGWRNGRWIARLSRADISRLPLPHSKEEYSRMGLPKLDVLTPQNSQTIFINCRSQIAFRIRVT